jgi:proteasome alpha subunit
MPMPFYVAPEQLMKDRSDYARKGIARGKPVVAVEYADGILFIADNPSTHLYKISEIYDRIADGRTSPPRAWPTRTPRAWPTSSPRR